MEFGEIQDIEYKHKSSISDKNLRQNMGYLFQDYLIKSDEDTPIACITFVLSAFISTDYELKTKFLTNF